MTKARILADYVAGGVTAAEHEYMDGVTSNVQTQFTALDTAKAPKASPTFTGTPAVPTASAATNTTQIASTAYVRTEVTNLVDSAPANLDTLNELAAALGDDNDYATTITGLLSAKAPLASPDFTGTVDLTGTTVSLDDDEISLDKVNGGTLGTGTIGGSSVISTTGTITSTAASNNKISSGGWVNGDNSGAVPYDTLTESGTNLSSVISDGSAVAYAKTNYLGLEVGKIYRLRVNVKEHASGQNPYFSIGGTTSASKYVAAQQVPSSGYSGTGIKDIIFECIDSDMAGTNADSARVWMNNGEATNFEVETSVTEDFLQK